MLYLMIVIAIFSSLLLLLNFWADLISCKLSCYEIKNNHNDKLNAKYKITLCCIMSFSWAYVLYCIIL